MVMSDEKRTLQERRLGKCRVRALYHERKRLGLDMLECVHIREFVAAPPSCGDCPGAGVDRRSGKDRREQGVPSWELRRK